MASATSVAISTWPSRCCPPRAVTAVLSTSLTGAPTEGEAVAVSGTRAPYVAAPTLRRTPSTATVRSRSVVLLAADLALDAPLGLAEHAGEDLDPVAVGDHAQDDDQQDPQHAAIL